LQYPGGVQSGWRTETDALMTIDHIVHHAICPSMLGYCASVSSTRSVCGWEKK
jgi:hypothetical protein